MVRLWGINNPTRFAAWSLTIGYWLIRESRGVIALRGKGVPGRRGTASNRVALGRGCALSLFLVTLGWLGAPHLVAGEPAAPSPFRFGFSTNLFRELNENDAKAALKVWVETLAKERGLFADTNVQLLAGGEVLRHALQGERVDGAFLTAAEYWSLGQPALFDRVVYGVTAGEIAEEYLLLVHRTSPITKLADLEGRTLGVLTHSKMSLARCWLDTTLLHEGLKPSAQFLGQIKEHNKLTKAVLPVFFRQADACLITRKGLNTMAELNPQVGKALRILLVSPRLVPDAFFFRTGYPREAKVRMVAELAKITSTVAGQQVLTVFQTDSLQEFPFSCLDSSLNLLEEHRRLTSQAGHGQPQFGTSSASQ